MNPDDDLDISEDNLESGTLSSTTEMGRVKHLIGKGVGGVNLEEAKFGRISVIVNAYHQAHNENPTHIQPGYTRLVDKDEQIFPPRKSRVNTEWKPLETGWIESGNASLLIIENNGTGTPMVQPTEEQRKKEQERIVEIGISIGSSVGIIPIAQIGVGRCFLLEPLRCDPKLYHARCVTDETKISVTVFPK